MPELPEVEIVCQALKPVLEKYFFLRTQLNRPNWRYPFSSNLKEALVNHLITIVIRAL